MIKNITLFTFYVHFIIYNEFYNVFLSFTVDGKEIRAGHNPEEEMEAYGFSDYTVTNVTSVDYSLELSPYSYTIIV